MENQEKWEEKGKIGKKMGSLPGACPCGREGLATALDMMYVIFLQSNSQNMIFITGYWLICTTTFNIALIQVPLV